VGTQYTDYGQLQDSGHRISNPANQYLHSSITQIYAGYAFSERFSLQLNLPYIYRSFRRVEGGAIENGKVSGLGDISLVGSWTALSLDRGDFRLVARVNGGIKLPTGESERLAEEGAEGHSHGEEEAGHDHAHHGDEHAEEEIASGVHGHDLALGTGGLDIILGGDVFCQWKRTFFEAGFQYTKRGNGGHSYDFADDFSWNAGAGFVVLEREGATATVGVRFSGESKGEDHFRNERADDTGITTVFVGPHASVTWGGLSADVGLDLPIRRDNSGVQTVPDYRVQAGLNWRF
jgi:hypothetical protein